MKDRNGNVGNIGKLFNRLGKSYPLEDEQEPEFKSKDKRLLKKTRYGKFKIYS